MRRLANDDLYVLGGEQLHVFIVDDVVILELEGDVEDADERWNLSLWLDEQLMCNLLKVLLAVYCK